MSEPIVYQASVFERDITYKTFNGEEKTAQLMFSLDPLSLMDVVVDFQDRPKSRSGDPRVSGKPREMSDNEQIQLVKDLAVRAAGSPSDDGEYWIRNRFFDETVSGQAFLAKLVSSDADRKEFTEKVILDPFRAFVNYAIADPSNSDKDRQEFRKMLTQLENIFEGQSKAAEDTPEQKRARLEELRKELEGDGVS